MAFLDDSANLGTALVVIAIVGFIDAISAIAGSFSHHAFRGLLLSGIGQAVCAVLFLRLGMEFRRSPYASMVMLSKYVRVVGITMIVSAVSSIAFGLFTVTVNLVFGLVVFWVSRRLDSHRRENVDRILWYLLVVAFALMALASLASALSSIPGLLASAWSLTVLASSLANLFVSVFMLILLMEGDVRMSMGT